MVNCLWTHFVLLSDLTDKSGQVLCFFPLRCQSQSGLRRTWTKPKSCVVNRSWWNRPWQWRVLALFAWVPSWLWARVCFLTWLVHWVWFCILVKVCSGLHSLRTPAGCQWEDLASVPEGLGLNIFMQVCSYSSLPRTSPHRYIGGTSSRLPAALRAYLVDGMFGQRLWSGWLEP